MPFIARRMWIMKRQCFYLESASNLISGMNNKIKFTFFEGRVYLEVLRMLPFFHRNGIFCTETWIEAFVSRLTNSSSWFFTLPKTCFTLMKKTLWYIVAWISESISCIWKMVKSKCENSFRMNWAESSLSLGNIHCIGYVILRNRRQSSR